MIAAMDWKSLARASKGIDVCPFTGCWLWTRSLNTSGYANFSVGKWTTRTHRWLYLTLTGPIPDGLVLDHLCRVRHCVNPDHLEPVTLSENSKRGLTGYVGAGAERKARTHCPSGHEYSGYNLIIRKYGNRGCRECQNIANREYRARVKAGR